ncbi:MAG TPA: hypothetical protein VF092_05330 [Longimicrobium sp.]
MSTSAKLASNRCSAIWPTEIVGPIRWPNEEARVWVAQLLTDTRVAVVVIYGSAVRAVTESNDVDLLLVADTEPAYAPPLDVDLHWVDAAQVDSAVAAGDEVLGWGLRFGIPLVDREGIWARLIERWGDLLPFPSAAAADERARRATTAAEGLRADGDCEAADEVLLAALTQRARARLIRAGIYPLSRPELPDQLVELGDVDLARQLTDLLNARI